MFGTYRTAAQPETSISWPTWTTQPSNLGAIVRDVCVSDDTDDGLKFDPDTVKAQRIKEDADYEGVRIRFRGKLGNARISMQMDVGFGDPIHPGAVQADYPALLDLPAPSLRMYPPETVIAEKAEAMVYLGSLNSRMKDFYDIWRMSQQFNFAGVELCEAISQTLGNRNTEIIEFDDLAVELLDNDNPDQQWSAFLRKSALVGPDTFSQVLAAISDFLSPVFSSIKGGNDFGRTWTATGPWRVDNGLRLCGGQGGDKPAGQPT